MARATPADRPDDVAGMVRDWQRGPRATGGYQRCFYTLWGREEERLWETVPDEDLVDCIVPGTGRQDWRKLRPFDLLPEVHSTGGMATRLLYVGECLRVACSHVVGAQPVFERAGDYDTVLFQFAGTARVETSFGPYELRPGEALHVPAMVAHRTIGSPSCRRMEYYPRDLLDVKLAPEQAVTESRFVVVPAGAPPAEEPAPAPARRTAESVST